MPIPILMPGVSATMAEGALARWRKQVGDPVAAGEVIAEIETDKAIVEIEAVDSGILARLLVPEGAQGIKVNQVIALLVAPGETLEAPATQPAAAPAAVEAAGVPQAPAGVVRERPQVGASGEGGRVFATPLARRVAEQAGLALAGIPGSGPNGRIVAADIEQALERRAAPSVPAAAGASKVRVLAAAGHPPHDEIPHTAMRRTIARRLSESKLGAPHFYLSIDCALDALLEAQAELNRLSHARISVNDLLIRACAVGLKRVPEVNAAWSEEAILLWRSVDVAVAVAVKGGLVTPVIRNADQKGLVAITAEMKSLGLRARAGELRPAEYTGGGITLSNLGMHGVKAFSAVINPPQSCILAVGAAEQRAVVRNGALAIATVMSCTLSADHRVVDGVLGAKFLAAFRQLVEDPRQMLL